MARIRSTSPSLSVALTFAFGVAGVTVSNGANTLTVNSNNLENFVGGSGDDQLLFTNYSTAITASLTSIGSLDGFAGNVTGIGTFDNINRVVGSTSTTDTLTGANLSNAWTLEVGSWKLEVGSNALIVSAIETVNGGTGADTFTFTDGAMFNGTLNGGAGNDQLLFTNYSTARNVVLTSVGAVDGFNGTEAKRDRLCQH